MKKLFEIFQAKFETAFPGLAKYFEPKNSQENVVAALLVDFGEKGKFTIVLWNDTVAAGQERFSLLKGIASEDFLEHQRVFTVKVKQKNEIDRMVIIDFVKKKNFAPEEMYVGGYGSSFGFDPEFYVSIMLVFLESIKEYQKLSASH